ncbi:MAG: glycerophosphodiester phosphodiesterase [Halioglobus sp.]
MKITTLIHQLQSSWRDFFILHLLFTLLGAAILTPLFGLLLRGTLALSGSAAVVDQDIARLVLSPLGMLGAIVLVSVFLAISGLELGAMQVLAQANKAGRRVRAATAARFALSRALPLLLVTLRLTLYVLAYVLPYLAIIAAIAWTQLTDYDINYYLAERPTAFIAVVAVAGALAVPLIWLLGRRLISWCLVLPIALFTTKTPAEAFANSESMVAGHRAYCFRSLGVWLVVALLLSVIPVIVLQLGMDLVLGSRESELTTLAAMLGLLGALWVALNFLVAAMNLAGFSTVIAQLFEELAPELASEQALPTAATDTSSNQRWNSARLAILAGVVAIIGAAVLLSMLRSVKLDDEVLIIAHRGSAGAAPENTIASISQAIEDGSDWVEIDVQETLDGEVIVIHDSDFMKLAGDPIKVWDGELARIQEIDVGSWFDPRFADQRVPTLAEVLQIIKNGDSRLVIELKYYGHDQQLEQRVIDIVEAAEMADRVAIMSLKLKGVQKLKGKRPQWTGGLLAATSVGDITKLDADFLAVNQNMANPAFIRRAHKAGKRVFVWTVNDALSLSHWMSMGVDGVITDEPALAREILAQREELSPAERLLLSAALFFGKPETINQYRDNSP